MTNYLKDGPFNVYMQPDESNPKAADWNQVFSKKGTDDMTDKQIELHIRKLHEAIDNEIVKRGALVDALTKRLDDALLRQDDLLDRCVDAGTSLEVQCTDLATRMDELEVHVLPRDPECNTMYDESAETEELPEADDDDVRVNPGDLDNYREDE